MLSSVDDHKDPRSHGFFLRYRTEIVPEMYMKKKDIFFLVTRVDIFSISLFKSPTTFILRFRGIHDPLNRKVLFVVVVCVQRISRTTLVG